MTGFLFEQIIFGPVRSRRLGISLGINLLPAGRKVCTFNCLYCECGWTDTESGCSNMDVTPLQMRATPTHPLRHEASIREREPEPLHTRFGYQALHFPSREEVADSLEKKLQTMSGKGDMLTNITFAGNGEPTLHPDFSAVIDDTIGFRNRYYPNAGISVLSNASCLFDESVAKALLRVDHNILKLDAGTEECFQKINKPRGAITLEEVTTNLARFKNQMEIQTLFVKGSYQGVPFDNTTDQEVEAWLKRLALLKPIRVMIYPIARATPAEDVQKISLEKLQEIASKVEAIGLETEVYF